MKNTNRIRPNGSAKAAAQQVKTKPIQKQSRVQPPAEFKIVRLRECPVASAYMMDGEDVERFWRRFVATSPQFDPERETFVVFMLNTRKQVTGFQIVSHGTLDSVLVHPREVFRLAAVHSAASIMIAHNHPSGDPHPSEADISVTRSLIRAGQLMQIKVGDHIIIGAANQKRSHASLRALGYFYDFGSSTLPEFQAKAMAIPRSSPKAKMFPDVSGSTAPAKQLLAAEVAAPERKVNSTKKEIRRALDVEDALGMLRSEVAAGIALGLMNADSIQTAITDHQPGYTRHFVFAQEDANATPLAAEGMEHLMYNACARLDTAYHAWKKDQLGESGAEDRSMAVLAEMERALTSMFHLLRLQGEILVSYSKKKEGDSGAMDCAAAVIASLNRHWKASCKLSFKLREALAGNDAQQKAA